MAVENRIINSRWCGRCNRIVRAHKVQDWMECHNCTAPVYGRVITDAEARLFDADELAEEYFRRRRPAEGQRRAGW